MDLWTRENIKNYTGDPDESSDINYSKKQQEIRRAIRAVDKRTKKEGGTIYRVVFYNPRSFRRCIDEES